MDGMAEAPRGSGPRRRSEGTGARMGRSDSKYSHRYLYAYSYSYEYAYFYPPSFMMLGPAFVSPTGHITGSRHHRRRRRRR